MLSGCLGTAGWDLCIRYEVQCRGQHAGLSFWDRRRAVSLHSCDLQYLLHYSAHLHGALLLTLLYNYFGFPGPHEI